MPQLPHGDAKSGSNAISREVKQICLDQLKELGQLAGKDFLSPHFKLADEDFKGVRKGNFAYAKTRRSEFYFMQEDGGLFFCSGAVFKSPEVFDSYVGTTYLGFPEIIGISQYVMNKEAESALDGSQHVGRTIKFTESWMPYGSSKGGMYLERVTEENMAICRLSAEYDVFGKLNMVRIESDVKQGNQSLTKINREQISDLLKFETEEAKRTGEKVRRQHGTRAYKSFRKGGFDAAFDKFIEFVDSDPAVKRYEDGKEKFKLEKIKSGEVQLDEVPYLLGWDSSVVIDFKVSDNGLFLEKTGFCDGDEVLPISKNVEEALGLEYDKRVPAIGDEYLIELSVFDTPFVKRIPTSIDLVKEAKNMFERMEIQW